MIGLVWLLVGLVAVILLSAAVIWLVYVPVAARIFGAPPWLMADWHEPLPDGEETAVPAADGARLHGTYLPTTARSRKGVIVYCHELKGNRWNAVPYVQDLRRAGFDVFTFDFRDACTAEAAEPQGPMPWVTTREVADVRAVIDYLWQRPDADPRGIGILGVSKGGTAALCAAAGDPRVRALVVDGVIPTERMQIHFTRRFMGIYLRPIEWLLSRLPDFTLGILGTFARMLTQVRRRCRFVNVGMRARRVRQPVLFVHGAQDNYVPVEVVRRFRRLVPGETRLWVVPRAKHNGAIRIATAEYHRRVARFFRRQLVGETRRQPRPEYAATPARTSTEPSDRMSPAATG